MKENNISSPPKWADRFLEWYCNPKILEQIQGDVHELYHWRVEEQGNKKANNAFIWDVIRFFRWRNINKVNTQKQQFNNMGMFKNYMKIGWRNLLNQKVPSVINIFGLSCAIACCLVAYLFIESVWFRGMHHENKDEVYMITHTAEHNKQIQRYGYVSSPLSSLLKEEFPAIERAVRLTSNSVIVKYNNETFSERIFYVDSDFMDMFTYSLIYGSKESLLALDQVIITAKVANKFFGKRHPIGKEIDLVINGEQKIMMVGAVIEDLSSTAMFRFGILASYGHHEMVSVDLTISDKWKRESWQFIQVPEKDNLSQITEGLHKFTKLQNEICPNQKYLGLQLEPFNNLMNSATEIEGGVAFYGGMAPQILLGSIAIFMLTLAIFNYINIAISMATKRIKEIGVRKVIGARKGQLIFQFLSENLITCLIAIVLGGVIAAMLFLPWFNELTTNNFRIDLFNDPYIWIFFTSLLVFITIVSGSYPAFYISSFKPAIIFSGTQSIGSKSKFMGVLLVFQFALAMITIIAGVAFVNTNTSNENKDWGYDNEDKIVVNVPSNKDYQQLSHTFSTHPDVIEMAGSRHHIGDYTTKGMVNYNNKDFDVNIIEAASNYPNIMGLRLIQGQLFNNNIENQVKTEIIVNQIFMDWLEYDFTTDQYITLDSIRYNVIGVVEDFHYSDFSFSIDPTIIKVMSDSNYNYLTLKVAPGTSKQLASFVKSAWLEQIDSELYQGKEQSTIFDQYFTDIASVSYILLFTATLAVILSAIGLFGLVSLNISARMKDVGIRKILGADMTHLSIAIYKRFVWLWIIGCILGGILGILSSSALLDMIYVYHPTTGITPLIIAVCVLVSVMFITITSQLFKVKNANPVDVLRLE